MFTIGIDEAGRGPWAGVVVACSLCFSNKKNIDKNILNLIGDSKKIPSKKRELIFDYLIENSIGENPLFYFGIGIVDNFLIDEINIKQANKEAMRRSLIEILRKIDNSKIKDILIDGSDNYNFKEINIIPKSIIKGDSKIKEISAASIIAKVFRDKLLDTYSILYPDLGLKKHKGYGTKKHIEYLTGKNKITSIHRLSYKPIKNILEN